MEEKSENTLKEAVKTLIKAGTTYDVQQLELTYHKNLKVFMVDENGQSNMLDKSTVLHMFQSKKDNGDTPLNDWMNFSNIELDDELGHTIITRKVNLTGKEQTFVFSIEWVWEDNRWQVSREVSVVQAAV